MKHKTLYDQIKLYLSLACFRHHLTTPKIKISIPKKVSTFKLTFPNFNFDKAASPGDRYG